MKRKYSLILWHAAAMLLCLSFASGAEFRGTLPLIIAAWGILHGVEFIHFAYRYKHLPQFKDCIPMHLAYFSGFVVVKITSFLHFEFYRLFGGEVRVWCRHNNRRYTVFHPNWL